MTPRGRRFVWAVVVLVLLLFIGRWSVAFVAERWWAATISPSAAAFVTNWQLLGILLDVGAIIVASLWFALHALVVARAIASVQVTHRLGNLHLREVVPTRLLLAGAVASGILLGLIAGAGAHAWRDPIVLAWHGVTYGVLDPLLNLDVGVFVAQLPAWELLHRFAALLAVVGLAFCLTLYASIGALRRERGAVVVHPDARRHLGVLLALVAVTTAVGYRLAPYHLAAAALPSLTLVGALSRVRAAEVMCGIAMAAALLSLFWALRGRNSLLAAGWIVLALGAVGERYAIPALAEQGPPSPSRTALVRRFDALAWGIREAPAVRETEATPAVTALWDEDVLGRLVERGGGSLEAATPADARTLDGQVHPIWLVATSPPGDAAQLEVWAVEDGATTAAGAPIMLRSSEEARSVRPVWRSVTDPRSRPASPPWRSVTVGVNARSPLRRLLLAWARQAPGILSDKSHGDVDWHLDPVARAGAVLPMLSWTAADLVILNSRPTWLVQGLATSDEFPLATRARWRDGRVAGVGPAVLCAIDAATGETRFFADPAADSLATSWINVAGSLVAPAATIPAELRARISYRPEWLQAQLAVLEGPGWNAGTAVQSEAGAPLWLPLLAPARQVALEDPARNVIATVVTAFRTGGIPRLRLDHPDPDAALIDGLAQLRQLWSRAAIVAHLRDSVTAAGGTVWSRGPRWFPGRTPAAWQALFAVPHNGMPTLLWISTKIGDRIGGGRAPGEAWRSVTEPDQVADSRHPDDAATLELARAAVQRADSALRRGDMTAFGRAFEDVRRAVLRPPH